MYAMQHNNNKNNKEPCCKNIFLRANFRPNRASTGTVKSMKRKSESEKNDLKYIWK